MNSCLPVRVVVADDHPLVRAGVVATLNDPDAYLVVGQARNNLETLALVREHRPHLLILDLQMDDYRPAAVIEECLQTFSELRILILSSRSDATDLAPLQHLDIHGFVAKQEAPERLLQAVRVVMAGERWFSHQVSRSFHSLREKARNSPENSLTVREKQVLAALVRAKDNQAIAQELDISIHTVRRYVTQIFQKLGVKNRMEAIVWVKENGTL